MVAHSSIDHTGITGVGGGGVTQAYVGYNTVGVSTEVFTSKRVYMKKVTIGTACLITDIEAYVDTTTDKVDNFIAVLFADNAGSPKEILAFNGGVTVASAILPTHQIGAGAARWMGQAMGYWAVAADYWIAVGSGSDADIGMRIYKDGSGTDRYYTAGGVWITDAGYSAVTTSTDKYSIRANTIR